MVWREEENCKDWQRAKIKKIKIAVFWIQSWRDNKDTFPQSPTQKYLLDSDCAGIQMILCPCAPATKD